MNKLLFQSKTLHTQVGIAMLCLLSGVAYATTTLTFTDNTNPLNPFPATGAVGAFPFAPIPGGPQAGLNPEFRVVSATDNVSGGGEKSITSVAAGVTWEFSDDVNLTQVLNSEMTPGTDGSIPQSISPVAPQGDIGLFLNAPFLGSPFGFVAPTIGSAAGNFYGNATISVDVSGGTLQVVMPVAEAQWGQGYFPLGQADDGVNGTQITFFGTMTNIQLDTPTVGQATFDYKFTANHIIQASEDDLGFTGQTTQWELNGTGVAPILVANPPTAATGVLSATLPGTTSTDDGRVTKEELSTIYLLPDDTDADQSCVGSCFAFTVTGITGPTEQIILPLTAPIPSNAVYRKYINGSWTTFDTSAGDTVESGLGAPGDCTGVTYAPGLTTGDFCVRITITEGGLNDADGATIDSTIIDPGGVGVISGTQEDITLPGQSLDEAGGCTIGSTNTRLRDRSEWIAVFLFVSMLGWRKYKQHKE